MFIKCGSFAKSTNTSVPVSQSVEGVGFLPKCVFLWNTLQTSAGTSTPHALGIGVAVGTGSTDQIGSTVWAQDNVNPTQGSRVTNQSLSCILDNNTSGTGARVADGVLTSFDTDGFTIRWDINNAVAYNLQYLCLGGAGFQVKLINTANEAGTGNRSLTGAGFKPDLVYFFPSGSTVWPSQAFAGNIGVGAAISSTKRWAWGINSIDGVSMGSSDQGVKSQRTDRCAHIFGTGATIAYSADFVSMDSDGCTINVITNSGAGGSMWWLAFRGGWYDIGSFAKSTGGAPVTDSVTSIGRRPRMVMIQTYGSAAATTVQDDATHSWGVSDGTTEQCAVGYHKNKTLPTVCSMSQATDKANRNISDATTLSEADLAFTNTGFDMTWTTNDAIAAQVLWLAMGGTAPPVYQRKWRRSRKRKVY